MTETSPQGGSLQQQVLQRYTALMLLRPSLSGLSPSEPAWGGELLLVCGLRESGSALALASNIAGAVCLSIEPDPQLVKGSQRIGACDFAVNTLDEALRTMKNEVRKGRALSVGLQGEFEAVLADILERGVAPVAAVDTAGVITSFSRLREVGAKLVRLGSGEADIETDIDGEALVSQWAVKEGYGLHCVPVADFAGLRALDTELKQLVGDENGMRRRWLERAPQHFQRERPLGRAVWLREDEAESLRKSGLQL